MEGQEGEKGGFTAGLVFTSSPLTLYSCYPPLLLYDRLLCFLPPLVYVKNHLIFASGVTRYNISVSHSVSFSLFFVS